MNRQRPEATPNTCPRCGQPTLTGWDADTLGSKATVTQTHLTTNGEAQAWAAGVRTYELERGRLAWRDRDAIHDRPANKAHVYPAHQCWQTLDSTPPDNQTTGQDAPWLGQDQPPY